MASAQARGPDIELNPYGNLRATKSSNDHQTPQIAVSPPREGAPASSTPIMYPPTSKYSRGNSYNTAASGSQSSLPLARHAEHQGYEMHTNPSRQDAEHDPRTPASRGGQSWDPFVPIRGFEQSYDNFDTRKASEKYLAFADGDVPKNKVSKFYHWLLNVSVVTRWFIFIVPILGVVWVPGILYFTVSGAHEWTIWGVKFIWWSIWLTVVWAGLWVSFAVSRILPVIIRHTIGVIAVGTRKYIDWAIVLYRYVGAFFWSLAVWVSWQPLIATRQVADASPRSHSAVHTGGQLFFGLFICAAILLFEKFGIQWIAGKFHEKSYSDRIADQKFAVRSLVTLYRHSTNIPGRTDTLGDGHHSSSSEFNASKIFKSAVRGVKGMATTTTTALGNVASEIAGTSVLQPNSPQAMVQTALESANKSRLLARRIFYSFSKPNAEYMLVEDIANLFSSTQEAEAVFNLFDKDANGDATRDEVELACMEFHREQLSLEHSMRDVDSAVGRLDNILMSIYVVVVCLIIAVSLEAQVSTLIASAGTLVLGLSWLIGSSLGEVLTSIIFLFVKHPFDVGDRVDLNGQSYTVKEINLLSTVFLDSKAVYVQAPNVVLNTLFIQNIRRSPQMSETFTFEVAYGTTFEQLEQLRQKMLEFTAANKRDYQTVFDVSIVDFPGQTKMTCSADIKYKSNAQQGALKSKRRNRWICALKAAMAEVKVFGPSGDPNAAASVNRYTEVPWSEIKAEERRKHQPPESPPPAGGWALSDKNAMMLDSADVFEERDQASLQQPRRGLSNETRGPSTPAPGRP